MVNANIRNEARGQHFAFVLGLVIGVGALALVALGHEPWGLAAILAELAAFVGIFVYGKKKQQTELAKKRRGEEK